MNPVPKHRFLVIIPNSQFVQIVYFLCQEEEKNVKKSEDIEGYRGNEDVESILQFIGNFPESWNLGVGSS
jgi:hypothetical protein